MEVLSSIDKVLAGVFESAGVFYLRIRLFSLVFCFSIGTERVSINSLKKIYKFERDFQNGISKNNTIKVVK